LIEGSNLDHLHRPIRNALNLVAASGWAFVTPTEVDQSLADALDRHGPVGTGGQAVDGIRELDQIEALCFLVLRSHH
jgi:hypothetical protein